MSGKMGKQQRDSLQYCKEVIAIFGKINTLENRVKERYITESAELIRKIGETLAEVVKAFDKMDDYAFIQRINQESLSKSWSDRDDYENACKYVEYMVETARNIIEIGENTDQRMCLCCQDTVYFVPSSPKLSSIYDVRNAISNYDDLRENICPNCLSNDRDRLIIKFLKKMGLDKGNKPVKVLGIIPSKAIEHWIYAECPTVIYQSVNLDLNGKTIPVFSQIAELQNQSYDCIFCSAHFLCEKEDNDLTNELIRILKPDGLCMFSIPVLGVSGSGNEEKDFLNTGFIKGLVDAGLILHKLTENSCPGDGVAENAVMFALTKVKKDIDEIILQRTADRYDDSMEKPLVSVIMSVYNHEKYVSQAIESVLNQGYGNIEFLVADDCSADGSAGEILKYENQIDQIHLFEENGFGRIPFLLSIAKGKYVAVLDSDDYWESDKIQRQVLYMETHPECGACFTGVRSVDRNGEEVDLHIFTTENRSSAEWINFFYHNGNCLAYSSVMIRKELHNKVMRYASNFSIVPDYIMWLNVLLDYDIYLIEKELLNYRWHNANDSKVTENRLKNQFFEETYCWLDVMKKMDSDLFLRAFGEELTDPDVKEPRDVLCEKALLLLKSKKPRYRLAGLFYAYELLSDQENKRIMQEKYHIGRQDIYEILNSI